jgi:hypothetical protein
MRRRLLAAARSRMAGAITVSFALAALADERFHDVFADVDDDFCGTGQPIEFAVDVTGNLWDAPHKADFKQTATGSVTLTNPLTGDTAVNRFAGPSWVVLISGDPEGDHVDVVTVKGLPEHWKLAHGGVLIRDAGYAVIRNTVENDEVVDQEILLERGPHPDLESDFELFCEVMPEALGIES